MTRQSNTRSKALRMKKVRRVGEFERNVELVRVAFGMPSCVCHQGGRASGGIRIGGQVLYSGFS